MHKDLCIRSWSSNWFRQLIACLLMIYRNPELVASLCKIGLPGSLKWHSSVIFQPISMKLALLFREHYGLWQRAYEKFIRTRQHVFFFSLELANSSLKIALLTLASRCKKVIHVEFKLKIMIYISNIHVYLHLKLCFI